MRELRLPFLAGICMIVLLSLVAFSLRGSVSENGMLKVTFLDVGQGDATLIESPSGTQVLIDGGKGSVVLQRLSAHMGFFDKDLDMVVATHPDMDHIGGLIDVLDRYTVHTILMTENMGSTPTFETFIQKVKDEHADIIYARTGQVFDLGKGAQGSTTFTILFPDHDPTNLESNMSSIVGRLVYGESEYMLTGDSPQEIETYLVSLYGDELSSDVLKAGHHGSRTSSSEVFVYAVHPQYVIYSAGKDNSYGHPHKEVTDLMIAHGIIQKNTADQGSISSVSDGIEIRFK